MLVKDMIAALQRCNPNSPCMFWDYRTKSYSPLTCNGYVDEDEQIDNPYVDFEADMRGSTQTTRIKWKNIK